MIVFYSLSTFTCFTMLWPVFVLAVQYLQYIRSTRRPTTPRLMGWWSSSTAPSPQFWQRQWREEGKTGTSISHLCCSHTEPPRNSPRRNHLSSFCIEEIPDYRLMRYCYHPADKTGEARKYARPYHGPYRILAVTTNMLPR